MGDSGLQALGRRWGDSNGEIDKHQEARGFSFRGEQRTDVLGVSDALFPAAQVRAWSPRSARRRLLPVAAILLFVAVGSILAPTAPKGLFRLGARRIAEELLTGGGLSLALLLAIGTTLFLARGRRRGRNWRQVTFGGTTLALGTAFLLLAAGARIVTVETTKAPGGSAAETASPGQTQAARAWSMRMTGIVVELSLPWRAEPGVDAMLRSGNTDALRAKVAGDRAQLLVLLRDLDSIPPSSVAQLTAATAAFRELATLTLRGYDDYLRGLRGNARARIPLVADRVDRRWIAHGRAAFQQAHRLGRTLGPRLFSLNRLFYGS